jgi:mono/diheme cytochrome c family protein
VIERSLLLAASLFSLTLATTVGCATSRPASSAPTIPAQTFAEQVAAGQSVYGQHCAECHGAAGQGDRAPRLVGLKEGALPLDPPAERKFRKTQFVTVADVADFAVQNMPPKQGARRRARRAAVDRQRGDRRGGLIRS